MPELDAGAGLDAAPAEPAGLAGRIMDAVASLATGLAAVLVLLTLAVVTYSVFKRYVLGTPVTWTDELSGYLVVAMVMLGAADALRRGEHIAVDLLSSRARGRLRVCLGAWGMLSVALFAAAILYSAVLMVHFSFGFGIYSEGYLALPMWIPQSMVVLGAALLLLMAITGLIAVVRKRPGP